MSFKAHITSGFLTMYMSAVASFYSFHPLGIYDTFIRLLYSVCVRIYYDIERRAAADMLYDILMSRFQERNAPHFIVYPPPPAPTKILLIMNAFYSSLYLCHNWNYIFLFGRNTFCKLIKY